MQDPNEAQHDSMPRSAIRYVAVDSVRPVRELGPLLLDLCGSPLLDDGGSVPLDAPPVARGLEIEAKIALEGRGLELGVMSLRPPAPFTCPECHGVLVALKGGGVPRFRCHTGHAFSVNTLLAEVTAYVEDTLWNGVRAIEESMMLLRHLAHHVREHEGAASAMSMLLDRKASDAGHRADTVRQALLDHEKVSMDSVKATGRPKDE